MDSNSGYKKGQRTTHNVALISPHLIIHPNQNEMLCASVFCELMSHQLEDLCNLEELWWIVPTKQFASILYQGICNIHNYTELLSEGGNLVDLFVALAWFSCRESILDVEIHGLC